MVLVRVFKTGSLAVHVPVFQAVGIPFGQTTTSIVQSSPVASRGISLDATTGKP